MPPISPAPTLSPSDPTENGRTLRRLIADLNVSYGVEDSCKLLPHRLERDRFLLTLSLSAFGPRPHARLFRLLADMAMPDPLVAAVREAAEGAVLVHFGHEGGEAGAVAKVYFEYRQTGAAPVYRAFKWRGALIDETHYIRVDLSACARAGAPVERDAAEDGCAADVLAARIAERVGIDGLVGDCMRQVLSYPDVRRAAPDLMLLDVVDTNSPRRSIDLNIYAAELAKGSVYDLLGRLGQGFAIPARDIDGLAAVLARQRLGHVAGGTDRTGAPFVTLYYGVRAG